MSAASWGACGGERTTKLAQVRFIAKVVPKSVAKQIWKRAPGTKTSDTRRHSQRVGTGDSWCRSVPIVVPAQSYLGQDRLVRREAFSVLVDLKERDVGGPWRDAIRGLVERIALTPGPARGWMDATLHGELGTIIQWTAATSGKYETDTP